MSEFVLKFNLNGEDQVIITEPGKTLLSMLRDDLKLTSIKEGCGQGDCGACVVVLDGQAVNSCLVLVGQVQDSSVVTLEGLGDPQNMHPLQKEFMERWAFQCGYCTPGMLMSCYALLQINPSPTREEINEAISGNLCRCTSYKNIVDSVEAVAVQLNSEAVGEEPDAA